MPPADVLLAVVSIINAIAAGTALIIHAIRVPYRGSNAAESVAMTQAGIAARASLRPEETAHATAEAPELVGRAD